MKSIKQRAKDADLIRIPKGMSERCANCSFLDKKSNLCKHKEVLFVIKDPANECCKYWINPKVDRSKTQ